MLSVSGEAPQEPVVSTKSGVVYEKRLVEQYIAEHGTEPNSTEPLAAEDLLPLKSSRIVRPRPPTLTSIPALLATFQNEWDALALETYNLKEQLSRTREELATALYQHDAAVRVIARLTKERDEARDALGKLTVADGAANGEAMAVDSVEALPESFAASVDETLASLSQGRRRRPIPDGWVTPDEVSALEAEATSALPVPQTSSLDIEDATAAIGGYKGQSATYLIETDAVEHQLAVDEPVTATLSTASRVIFATSQGSVKVYQNGDQSAEVTEHAGAATGLSIHPGGRILASVGTDKSIVFYDLESMKRISRAYADSCKCFNFNPMVVQDANNSSFDDVPVSSRRTSHCSRNLLRQDQALLDQDPRTGWRVRDGRPRSGCDLFRERLLACRHC